MKKIFWCGMCDHENLDPVDDFKAYCECCKQCEFFNSRAYAPTNFEPSAYAKENQLVVVPSQGFTYYKINGIEQLYMKKE